MGCAMTDCKKAWGELEDRMRLVEHNDIRFAEALEGIKKNTDELLSVARHEVRLEERQMSQGQAIDRAFAAIEKLSASSDTRLRLLESNAPTNNLATKWIFAGVAAAISAAVTWVGKHL